MKSSSSLFFILLGVLCLSLYFADTIHGRKDPGEYWHEVMKDEPIPELIHALISKSSPSLTKHHHGHNHDHHNLQGSSFQARDSGHDHNSKPQPAKKTDEKDSEPRPHNVSSYNDDSKLHKKEKSYKKDVEPRPNISSYNDDSELKAKKDFEPRPNISAYKDEVGLEADKGLKADFEPRPNISAYGDDGKPENKKKSFVEGEYEPRPNISAYTDDVKQQIKSYDE